MSRIVSTAMIADEVRRYIEVEFLLDDDPGDLQDTDLLFEGGIIDSAGALSLVIFLEQTYGIEVSDEELFPSNFATIRHIVRFIKRKKQIECSSVEGD